jgi:hypothetical protein
MEIKSRKPDIGHCEIFLILQFFDRTPSSRDIDCLKIVNKTVNSWRVPRFWSMDIFCDILAWWAGTTRPEAVCLAVHGTDEWLMAVVSSLLLMWKVNFFPSNKFGI